MYQKFVRKYHEKNTASYDELKKFSLHIGVQSRHFQWMYIYMHLVTATILAGKTRAPCGCLRSPISENWLSLQFLSRWLSNIALLYVSWREGHVSTLGRTCAFDWFKKNRKLFGITDEDLTRMGLVIRLPSLANSSKCSTVLSKYICLSCSRSKMTVSC